MSRRPPTPLQLRRRAQARVRAAVAAGKLARLNGTIKCTDCDAPAECYDHRNYYHALAVDPVCKGCNNRRGPGFPLNPDGDEYRNESSRKLGGHVGQRWSGLEAGKKPRRDDSYNDAGGGQPDLVDEHWVTWEPDIDVWKFRQEAIRHNRRGDHRFYLKSFQRGLYDWFGVEPI